MHAASGSIQRTDAVAAQLKDLVNVGIQLLSIAVRRAVGPDHPIKVSALFAGLLAAGLVPADRLAVVVEDCIVRVLPRRVGLPRHERLSRDIKHLSANSRQRSS